MLVHIHRSDPPIRYHPFEYCGLSSTPSNTFCGGRHETRISQRLSAHALNALSEGILICFARLLNLHGVYVMHADRRGGKTLDGEAINPTFRWLLIGRKTSVILRDDPGLPGRVLLEDTRDPWLVYVLGTSYTARISSGEVLHCVSMASTFSHGQSMSSKFSLLPRPSYSRIDTQGIGW